MSRRTDTLFPHFVNLIAEYEEIYLRNIEKMEAEIEAYSDKLTVYKLELEELRSSQNSPHYAAAIERHIKAVQDLIFTIEYE
jgi:FtsZ-binding cell division protein ZapB